MANVSSSNGLEKRPKLRFPGFDEPWKETALSSVLTERNEYAEKDGTYEHATLSKEGIYGKTARYDRDFLVSTENKKYKVTHLGDLCYNPANLKFGVICLNTYGDAIFSPIYVTFEIDASSDPDFIGAYLTRWDFINRALKYQQGTVYERMAVSPEDFVSIKCCFPQKAEQTRLAEFITLLDNRIAAQGKYVESLKKYKRGLLNKVFSNTDEKIYPTVYLSEVADFLQGLTYSPSDVANAGHLVLRSSNIQNGTLSFDDCVYVDKSIPESLQVKCADVIMCVRNGSKSLVGKTALIPIDMPKTTWGAFMMIVRSKLNDTYIFHYLNSQMFFSQVFKDTGTATINQITKGILNECRLPLPPVEERKKISKMLSTFDAKIYNAERTLYALMETRKALLQQLFI